MKDDNYKFLLREDDLFWVQEAAEVDPGAVDRLITAVDDRPTCGGGVVHRKTLRPLP